MSVTMDAILKEMGDLLLAHDEVQWGTTLIQLARSFRYSTEETKLKTLALFGGMGSLNDIVLYSEDGTTPMQENDRLAALRSQLYECSRT